MRTRPFITLTAAAFIASAFSALPAGPATADVTTREPVAWLPAMRTYDLDPY